MSEKELLKYRKYLKVKDRKKIGWIQKIKFWEYLMRDYNKQVIENARKSEKIHNLEMQLKITNQIKEQLENDLNIKGKSKKQQIYI